MTQEAKAGRESILCTGHLVYWRRPRHCSHSLFTSQANVSPWADRASPGPVHKARALPHNSKQQWGRREREKQKIMAYDSSVSQSMECLHFLLKHVYLLASPEWQSSRWNPTLWYQTPVFVALEFPIRKTSSRRHRKHTSQRWTRRKPHLWRRWALSPTWRRPDWEGVPSTKTKQAGQQWSVTDYGCEHKTPSRLNRCSHIQDYTPAHILRCTKMP